jgi:hypothetical protein
LNCTCCVSAVWAKTGEQLRKRKNREEMVPDDILNTEGHLGFKAKRLSIEEEYY